MSIKGKLVVVDEEEERTEEDEEKKKRRKKPGKDNVITYNSATVVHKPSSKETRLAL